MGRETHFELLLRSLQENLSGFNIKYKDESVLMRVLSRILFFNPEFMTKYTTTINQTVYFPSRTYMLESPRDRAVILAHEYRHARDASRLGFFMFSFLYLFPISLVPLAIALMFFNWLAGLVCAIVVLLPWPAYWRKKFELEAYSITLFIVDKYLQELGINADDRKKALLNQAVLLNKQFTTFSYYLMWPFGVRKALEKEVNLIISGTERTDPIYKELSDAIENK